MFGKSGFVKRVNCAVDATLEEGEERLAAIYVQGPARPPSRSEVATSGLAAAAALVSSAPNAASQMSTAWLLAVTDRRLLVLAMDGLTARSATLADAFPVTAVTVTASTRTSFTLAFPDGGHVTYRVLPAWRHEAGELVPLLSGAAKSN